MSQLMLAIDADIIKAMRDRSIKGQFELAQLRSIKANVKNKAIELRRDLVDSEIVSVMESMLKRHEESITQFKAGKREDLVSIESAQAEMLKTYLPREVTEEEIKEIVSKLVETGAFAKKDMGQLIKEVKAHFSNCNLRVDGKLLSGIVKAKLSGFI